MRGYHRFALGINIIFLLSLTVGCRPIQKQSLPEDFVPTCIQGRVWYRTPTGATPVPFPHAPITAWRHGTDQPLAETKADEAGNYCIEVPLGVSGVDLRIWEVRRLGGTRSVCKGSREIIDPGTISKKCGEDCVRIEITTDCQEFHPPYHRQM